MLNYEIPDNYLEEIENFSRQVKDFRSGTLEPTAFKGIRVGQGIYEQRKNDTFMVRMRNVGGVVTPAQLRKVAEVSEKFGAEHFHVTTRQDLQLHYARLEDVQEMQKELAQAGISTRGGGGNTVRNMMVSVDSGIRKDEAFDVTPHAIALSTLMIAEPDSFDLPRKLKTFFHNGPERIIDTAVTCIGLTARIVDGKRGFLVEVGGGMGAVPKIGVFLLDFLPEEELATFFKAVKRVFDRHGNRRNRMKSRLKFLRESLGTEKFLELIHAEMEVLKKEGLSPLVLHEIVNSDQSSAKLTAVEASGADFELWKNRYVRPQKQVGLFTVRVPLRLGDIQNADGLRLAKLLENFGENSLRMSGEQNAHLRNIPERFLGLVYTKINEMDFLSHQPSLLTRMVSCTGADTCKLGLCLPRGVTPEIQTVLKNSGLDLEKLKDFKIHISGCPNSCGKHPVADLGFFGRTANHKGHQYPAYNVLAGTRCDENGSVMARRITMVSSKFLPDFICELLTHWLKICSEHDSFTHWIDADGEEFVKETAIRYQEVPDYEETPSHYRDWGATEDFSILKGQKAECAASIFDLIAHDAKEIERVSNSLEKTVPSGDEATLLYDLARFSARMLLVTRGIEPRDDESNFVNFRQHFIEAGLVDRKFSDVVELSRMGEKELLPKRREQVCALADAVLKLYAGLDNSLKFREEKKSVAEKDSATQEKATESRDFRGVACPMNFVKTKIVLEGMESGQMLEILLDHGEPIENVPNSLKLDGHKILEQKRQADDHWKVLIKKG